MEGVVDKTFREYEFPPGRDARSFRFRIDEIYNGLETDTLFTDDPVEVDRIVHLMRRQGYNVRVTELDDVEKCYIAD